MLFCSNCGNKLEDGAIFCSACGKIVENSASSDANSRNDTQPPRKRSKGNWGLIVGIIIVILGIVFVASDMKSCSNTGDGKYITAVKNEIEKIYGDKVEVSSAKIIDSDNYGRKLVQVECYIPTTSGKEYITQLIPIYFRDTTVGTYRYWDDFYIYSEQSNTSAMLSVIPEEAEIVKSIFSDYLAGDGITAIMKRLNESGYSTQSGHVFHKSAVERILRNYAYTGSLLLQTKFRENHLTKKTLKNDGELPKYHATETHEAIISMETFEAVQAEMQRRAQKYAKKQTRQTYLFSGKITCVICGKHYRRKVTTTGPVWICSTYNTYGKSRCASKAIPEVALFAMAAEVADTAEIAAVTAEKDNTLVFSLKSGETAVKRWQDRSRAESWTEERRCAVGQKTRERNERNAQG